nr:peroxide stress protein YaaA [Peptoniphilus rachelemmaiella]
MDGASLKSLQKKNFTDKLADCCIYNLASKEFSERIDKKQVARWIDVEFYMDPSMKKRAPSATCKKLRGQLAAHLLAMESFEEKTFAAFRCDGFHLLPLDEEGRYVYTR